MFNAVGRRSDHCDFSNWFETENLPLGSADRQGAHKWWGIDRKVYKAAKRKELVQRGCFETGYFQMAAGRNTVKSNEKQLSVMRPPIGCMR